MKKIVNKIEILLRYFVIILFSFTLLIGCSKEESKHETIKKLNEVETQTIIKKYNTLSGWDTIRYDFTINYQNLLEDTVKPIKFEGYVNDIFYRDSTYFLILEKNSKSSYIDKFIAEVKMTNIQYQRLFADLQKNRKAEIGVFILKLKDVMPINPTTSIDNDSEEPFLYYDYSTKSILFKCELIDFYIKVVD